MLANKSRLKIIDIRVRELRTIREVGSIEPAWDPGGSMSFSVGGGSFVEIQTDQGLTGIGPDVEPSIASIAREHLVGRDPFDVERHASVLQYFAPNVAYRGVAGVDIALWDLIGKACGQPLYKLWGGDQGSVAPYASLIKLSTPEERAELAVDLANQGWKAIKLRLHHLSMREDIETVEAVRRAVGDTMTIMVDANQAQSSGDWQPGVRWDFRRAVETARELQRLNCYWLEEPLGRYAFPELAELRRRVELPIAGGENNPGVHEFTQILDAGAYDVLQPESLVLGGITSLRKIGALAEAYRKRIVPHHGGGGLGVIAHLHLVASWPHAPYLELLHDPPVADYRHRFAIMEDPPLVGDDGLVPVPEGPGLGVEIDGELIV